jgi:hypothetical protein
MAVKIHTEDGDECEHDENQRSLLMVSFRSVGPFFGSICAAPINGTTFFEPWRGRVQRGLLLPIPEQIAIVSTAAMHGRWQVSV